MQDSEQPLSDETIAKLHRALEFIGNHFDENPTLTEIADEAGMSPFHFHRIFTRHFGKTPKRRLDELRILSAMEMIKRGDSLPSIAKATGFAHHSHFTSRFKLVVGQPPTRWLSQWKLSGKNSPVDVAAFWPATPDRPRKSRTGTPAGVPRSRR